MICDFCGNVSENKRAVSLYMRAARITYIDCPECGCALSIKELRAAVRNYNEQFEEKRVRWITIHGRHIPMREKDAAGGGGSAKTGLTTGGGSGIIKHKEKEDFIFEDQKITKFLLKPGAKHYKEFAMVGYSENDYQKLYDDITGQFDKTKLVYNGLNGGNNESYNQRVRLGITKKKNYLLSFEVRNQKLRFVTAHMVKGDE